MNHKNKDKIIEIQYSSWKDITNVYIQNFVKGCMMDGDKPVLYWDLNEKALCAYISYF